MSKLEPLIWSLEFEPSNKMVAPNFIIAVPKEHALFTCKIKTEKPASFASLFYFSGNIFYKQTSCAQISRATSILQFRILH